MQEKVLSGGKDIFSNYIDSLNGHSKEDWQGKIKNRQWGRAEYLLFRSANMFPEEERAEYRTIWNNLYFLSLSQKSEELTKQCHILAVAYSISDEARDIALQAFENTLQTE